MDVLLQWLTYHDRGLTILGIILGGIAIYYIGDWLLIRIVRRVVKGSHRDWHHKDIEKRQKTVVALILTIWRLIVVLSCSFSILKQLFPMLDLSPLFASAGIIGVALGFGAQSLIKDFLSGIFIISENQYRVGDIIDIDGASGTVERIGTRSTVLRDADGNVHYFPNGMVAHVINKTMGYSMARFSISIDPSSDLDQVVAIINRVGEQLAHEADWERKIIEAPAFVSVGEFTGNSVDILIAGKTQPSDQWSVTAELRKRLLEEFEQAGIKLAILPIIPGATPQKRGKK